MANMLYFFLGAPLLLLVVGGWIVHETAKIGVGYSAKQLCSGVFVSELPGEFTLKYDIVPRLQSIGPLSGLLTTEIASDSVSATLFTASATATYTPPYGCTLHGVASPTASRNDQGLAAPVEANENSASMESNEELPTQRLTSSAIEPFLASLFSEPPEGGRNTLAVVVMHKGDIIAERYALPVLPSSRLQGWSMNKSLMASFVGLQVERGLLDLDLPVRDQLSHLGVDSGVITDLSADLTLKHLLSMASGLDFDERYYPGDDVTEMLYGNGPMWQVPLKQGHRVMPGAEFVYSSGDTNVVSYLWQQSLAGEDYAAWLSREVYGPLELDRPALEPDSSGVQVGSSFAYLTARDWARLGQWWLDAWHGRDELLSQVWQRGAVTPGVARGGDYYGLGFWLNTKQRKFPGVPENTFNAGGNSGQFVVVVPDAELVVVRLGLTLDESKVHLAPFLRQVLAQVESEARDVAL